MSSVPESVEPEGPTIRPNLDVLGIIGRLPTGLISYIMDIVGLISVALRASRHLRNPKRRRIFRTLFTRQLYNTGVRALYINGMIAVIIGALLMSRLFDYIPKQVLAEQYGYLFVVIIFRELGPLISGIILISRSATAVTSEIGFLRMRREFQVLHGLGINPVFLFLLPVFFACAFYLLTPSSGWQTRASTLAFS